MENLKKIISLNEASKISGYHSDYLSALIRKKEIKGRKIAGNWFTTLEEINNYKFKQKIRHKKWAIGDFLSSDQRVKKILFYAFLLIIIFLFGLNFYTRKKIGEAKPVNTTLSPDNELGVIKEEVR